MVPWITVTATTYGIGDGFLGGHLACGGKLDLVALVVAHRSLRCGTKVEINYRGRTVKATVRDRGPYCCPLYCSVCSRTFDLGPAVSRALRFGGLGLIRWRRA